jgi:replicative DNA helicase
MARSALDHSKVVLGAVLSNSKPKRDREDLLSRLTSQLTEVHFPDLHYKNLYLILDRYFEGYGTVIPRATLEEMLVKRKLDTAKVALYLEMYDALAKSEVEPSDFKWSMDQLKEIAAEKKTAEAITTGMEILTRGAKGKKNEDLLGHKDARLHVLERFAEIDRELSMQESPEGDARMEGDEILAEFNEPRGQGGIKFGIPDLDAKVNGLQPGELDLIVGYSSSGKTTLATIQLAWSAAIQQGKNVVILTSETLRPQVRRKLICRHSMLAEFGLESGINSRHLKAGRDSGLMTPEELRALPAVIDDFTKNPNYGKLIIVQVPRGATIATCEGKLLRYQREFQVDLGIIDYLALLKPDRRFTSRREELAATIQEGKQMATTFDDGRGIPIVSPWQTSRDSWKEAQQVGYYNSSALAETAEATSTSDVVITLLEPKENESRYAQIKAQVVKNRDGEKSMGIDLMVDYATSYWSAERRIENNMDNMLLNSGSGMFGMM